MNLNTRFAIAVHVMCLLACSGAEKMLKSEQIARSVNTNPVVIRRLLSLLARAGLVVSHPGASGGSRLSRSSAQITLLEIYEAVADTNVFELPKSKPNAACYVGSRIEDILCEIRAEAEHALRNSLAQRRLAQLVGQIEDAPQNIGNNNLMPQHLTQNSDFDVIL